MKYLEPAFFIIGERKCGTSSLYRYLIEHPQVLPCAIKEPQFFSKPGWYRALNMWRYRSLFPAYEATQKQIKWHSLRPDGTVGSESLTFTADPRRHVITGEASANTFAQVPPERLRRVFPDARLIICLRHPVDRAYAHYCMLERFAREGRNVPIELSDFKNDFIEEIRKYRETGKGFFASVSFYYEKMKRWFDVFDRDQCYIIRTEDMSRAKEAGQIMNELCAFLGLDEFDFSNILTLRENVSRAKPLDTDLRDHLYEFYVEDVDNLESLLEMDFHWKV